MIDDVFTLHRGTTPLLVSVPHAGRDLPDAIRARLVDRALAVEDTDWHVEQLYAFCTTLGASFLQSHYSRFVIDLNRPGDDRPMYPGANNTELCPTRFFSGDPIYRPGLAPDAAEVQRRRARYWQPYHDALAGELERLRNVHGYAMLFDGHSIKAELPWLFEGRLPDLNFGTADGASCAPSLRVATSAVFADEKRHSSVIDGRFKGGYITRHYGQPTRGWHAVQLEMAWHVYLDDTRVPPTFAPERMASIEPLLRRLLETMLAWKPNA